MNSYSRYLSANAKLNDLISLEPPADRSPDALLSRARDRLAFMAAFLEQLGNPHRTVPVIHVAGTSGKGSTATAIAALLQATGRRVLLHTSPYLQVSTEKIQIDSTLLDPALFADLTDRVISAAETFGPGITYGEAWVALVALAMDRTRPDVAVIEVGAGGRFDLTNVVAPELAVITTIGIDHTESLGSTLAEIAWHKAGIIKPGIRVVHAITESDSLAAVNAQIAEVGPSQVTAIDPAMLGIRQEASGDWTWLDGASGVRQRSGIPGRPQAINGAIALAAVRAFDPTISIDAIRTGLASARIAARFETVATHPTVILDGAHNPQKMEALIPDLQRLPHPRIGVIGFLAAKRADEMLATLLPHLDGAVLTSPDVIGKAGLVPTAAADLVRSMAACPIQTAESIDQAMALALEWAGEDGVVIVTGSLYLCGAARERWYSSEQIIEQETQWPEQLLRPNSNSVELSGN